MIDSTEEEMSRGVVWGRVVINRFITIFARKNRATGEAKLKCLAKRVLKTVLTERVLNTVLRISVRRGKVPERARTCSLSPRKVAKTNYK